MQLFKFCNPEHNIHGGSKLQVGTLYKYRNIENDHLRDNGEGKYDFDIYFPESIELDRRWANLLLQGAIHFGDIDDTPRYPGSFSTDIIKSNITPTPNGVIVRDTEIKIRRSALNCLIFCMSMLNNASENPFPQYTDQWSIPQQRAAEFAARLGSLVFQQATLSAFDLSQLTKQTPHIASRLSINVRHRPVIYRDRRLIITPKNKPSFEELQAILFDAAFIKPSNFANEKEYRFVFELQSEAILLPVVAEHLLINPNVLTLL